MLRKILIAALAFPLLVPASVSAVPAAEAEPTRGALWAAVFHEKDCVPALEKILPRAAAEKSWGEYALAAEMLAARARNFFFRGKTARVQ